jgi:hypothetical protein
MVTSAAGARAGATEQLPYLEAGTARVYAATDDKGVVVVRVYPGDAEVQVTVDDAAAASISAQDRPAGRHRRTARNS